MHKAVGVPIAIVLPLYGDEHNLVNFKSVECMPIITNYPSSLGTYDKFQESMFYIYQQAAKIIGGKNARI